MHTSSSLPWTATSTQEETAELVCNATSLPPHPQGAPQQTVRVPPCSGTACHNFSFLYCIPVFLHPHLLAPPLPPPSLPDLTPSLTHHPGSPSVQGGPSSVPTMNTGGHPWPDWHYPTSAPHTLGLHVQQEMWGNSYPHYLTAGTPNDSLWSSKKCMIQSPSVSM
ncbi:hypothetical protein E2C01_001068 [Portunus trituberculatus]|uniref:Uncharacterized protein n=1 Tax=Portunus trituberculatus TaxID=210409 RepID=A0A5B7CIB6_PORTR|nr:hypothetical protein [Portunus trituberculatus]